MKKSNLNCFCIFFVLFFFSAYGMKKTEGKAVQTNFSFLQQLEKIKQLERDQFVLDGKLRVFFSHVSDLKNKDKENQLQIKELVKGLKAVSLYAKKIEEKVHSEGETKDRIDTQMEKLLLKCMKFLS